MCTRAIGLGARGLEGLEARYSRSSDREGISEHLTIGLAIVGATLASDYALQRVFKRWRCS